MQQDEFALQVGSNDLPQSEKRNGSVAEATSSTSENDIGASKIKSQSVKLGKTQSGPLVPGSVLGHSLSEKGRAFERYILFSSYIFVGVFILAGVGSLRENGMEKEMEERNGNKLPSLYLMIKGERKCGVKKVVQCMGLQHSGGLSRVHVCSLTLKS